MKLPQNFDQNEWFLIVWLIISFAVVFLLPKRFPLSITILIMLLSSTVARLSDHLLSSPNLDLYDVMDAPTYEIFDLLSYVLYPPFAYLFVYIFDKLNIRGFWIVTYIVIGSLGGIMYEWLSAYFNVFNYKGWHLRYSFSVYLISQTFTLLFFRYIKRTHELQTENTL